MSCKVALNRMAYKMGVLVLRAINNSVVIVDLHCVNSWTFKKYQLV